MPSKVILGSTKVVDFGTNRKRVVDFRHSCFNENKICVDIFGGWLERGVDENGDFRSFRSLYYIPKIQIQGHKRT